MYTSIGGVTKKLVDFLVENDGIKQIKEIYAVKDDNVIVKVWEKVSSLLCNTYVQYSGNAATSYGIENDSTHESVAFDNRSTSAGYPTFMGSIVIEGDFNNPEYEIRYSAFGVGTGYIGLQFTPYSGSDSLFYASPSHGEYTYTRTLSGSGDKIYINFRVPYYKSNPYEQSIVIYSLKINGEPVKFDFNVQVG